MFDNDAPRPSRLARAGLAATAILAGILAGFATLWTAFPGPIVLIAAMSAAGVVAARLRRDLPLTVVAVTVALVTATFAGQLVWSETILGFFSGAVYMVCFLVALLSTTVVRTRRDYVRRGWELAFAEAREHDARVEQAVTRERETMAGEIHDGLGHRLTLIAVQAARLSLDETLPAEAREELRRIRENAAAASDELGETVRLLSERAPGATSSLNGLGIADVIERARRSGLVVHSDVAPEVVHVVNDFTHAALLRALQEGLTNAAKHAPGTTVDVAIGLSDGDAVLEMRNPVAPAATATAPTGHGLLALRHRIAILGGTLRVRESEDFALIVRLPVTATPTAADAAPRPREGVLREQAAAVRRRHRRAARQAWLVPVALCGALVLVAVGYFVFAQFASILPPEDFAAIEVGDTRGEVEPLLPLRDMLDAPSSLRPEPPGVTCHYFEAAVSFFERVDVYRVCFAGDRVVAADTIPADE